MSKIPVFADVEFAAKNISKEVVRTPLIYLRSLSEKMGGAIFVKAENLQHVGAFKFRGAFNRLSVLTEAERKAGVVAFSSGNHAQGVALAAKILSVKAVIVMPSDAPKMKLENTLSYGAEVVTYDRETQSREEIAEKIAQETGAVVVPSFEDKYIIAGQGTAALEIITEGLERGLNFDVFISPIGGGGLISGCSLAFKALSPKTKIYGVEPEEFDDVKKSLEKGKIIKNTKTSGSICDALLSHCAGEITYGIMKENLTGILTISDQEALRAVKYAWQHLKLVLEPGGAAALAAILSGKMDVKNKNTVILLSGGNIDEELFEQALKIEL